MKEKPKLVLYYRKPRQSGNYSIEFIFDRLAAGLQQDYTIIKAVSSFFSSGFFKRLYITIEANTRQGDINHVIGDVHFLTLFLKKRNTVLTIHDCVFMNHPSRVAKSIFRLFWLKLPVMRSRVITVVSETTKNEVLRYVKCNPEKIKVIPNFISEAFKPANKPFNEECPEVLLIGTAPNKNLERIFEALKNINCRLIIIGQLTDHQAQLLETNKLNFQCYKNLTLEEMVSLYQQSDVLLFASLYEGFGMPILEAQATGIPVITSGISPMKEVAGEGACLVDPFDIESIKNGVTRIITDKAFRDKIVSIGSANVSKYTYQATIDQYKKVYEEILN